MADRNLMSIWSRHIKFCSKVNLTLATVIRCNLSVNKERTNYLLKGHLRVTHVAFKVEICNEELQFSG